MECGHRGIRRKRCSMQPGASIPSSPKGQNACRGFCGWTGEQVVMRKALRLHCQPGPNLASETPCGSPAVTAAPAVNTAATTIEGSRRSFQVGFMTGPFQLDYENLDDHPFPAGARPLLRWV